MHVERIISPNNTVKLNSAQFMMSMINWFITINNIYCIAVVLNCAIRSSLFNEMELHVFPDLM